MRCAPESVRTEIGFIAPIEGLRGVAVLLVVLFHYAFVLDARFADPWIAAIDSTMATKVVVRNGMLGVDLFFLITGFLLVLPWLRHAAEGRPAPSARAFYRRRALRILPAYYVQLLVLFLVLVPLLRGLEYWRYDPTHLLHNLWAHIFLVHHFSPATSASLSINGALWSLAVEVQFYLLLPLLAPWFARAPVRTAGGLFALAFAWRGLALHGFDGWVEYLRTIEPRWQVSEQAARQLIYLQLPGYAAHFATGMLAARAWWQWRSTPPSGRASGMWLTAGLAALLALWLLHAPGGWILGEFTWLLVVIALGIVVVALAARGIAIARPLLVNAPLQFVGRISYSAYLYHLPVLVLWNAYAPQTRGSWIVLPAYFATVLAIAWLSYSRVEVPGIGRPAPSGAGVAARPPLGESVALVDGSQ